MKAKAKKAETKKAVTKKLGLASPLEHFEPMMERIENSSVGFNHISKDFGLDPRHFRRICDRRPELKARFNEAKERQIDYLEEEILAVADDGQNDWMQRLAYNGANPGWEANGEHINRSRLRVDTRKWLLAKLRPRKWGDKVINEHQGSSDPDAPPIGIKVVFVTPKQSATIDTHAVIAEQSKMIS